MATEVSGKIGRTFGPFRYTIERGKIREFAQAVGDDNPLYYDVNAAKRAGFRDVPIPPTFPTVIDMWAGPNLDEMVKLLDIDPLKALHGGMEYKYLRDICAGDEITGKGRVLAAEAKKTLNLFTLETEYFNQHGELVLVARTVVIERL